MSFLSYYDSPKYASIKDKKLGYTYYSLLFLVFVYVFLQLGYYSEYFEYDPIIGTMRSKLDWNEKKVDVNQFNTSYCEENRCVRFEPHQLVYPNGLPDSIFVATKIIDEYETKSCFDCPLKEESVEYYTENPEAYYVKLKHSFVAPKFYEENPSDYYSKSNFGMKGKFLEEVGTQKPSDILVVGDILKSAGIDLAESWNYSGKVLPIRDRGCVILITIKYRNTYEGLLYSFTGEPYYDITTSYIPETDYKVIEFIDFNNGTLLNRKRHGVQLRFIQTGQIARFSFTVMLMHISSGVGLIAIVSTFVEFLALYLHPQSEIYNDILYEEVDVEKEKQD
eukprot:TRINITY_DN6372_c0_g1_i1.p1 TRINITY_DN6372_c0_g1~~TRINITY_DN6372_c0_g1_i1.p1  ORF type:complete len:351 (-),score=80.86 TRINITY_DN6372_c0_g1_i1:2100-3107(-)